MKIIGFVGLLLVFNSCDTFSGDLEIKNGSDQNLFIIATERLDLNKYPNDLMAMDYYYLVLEDSIKTMGVYNTTWKALVNSTENKCLSVFSINEDTLIKYSQEYVFEHNKFYSVNVFSLKQLEKMEWKIIIK